MSEKKQVLVCDDEMGVRESLNLILSEDYDIVFAESGLDAVEQIARHDFAAALLDIKMPKIHGLEILTRIKDLSPALPVIIVTGYQSAEIAKEALAKGACNYIPKPFEAAQILDAVGAAIASRQV